MEVPRLPVPEIRETIKHSYKQSTHRLRPPKLKPAKPQSLFNRSHSFTANTAHAVSFTEVNRSTLSASYDRSSDESYFEQCFTRLAKIGEGSFGEVFKVQSKDDGLLYAVKMSKQLFRGEHYRQERLEEVRRYEQFSDHANCVRFYRAWEQDNRLYMQMELCRENLESYLERIQPIEEQKIWSILLDLLLALKSLHDRNLIHLDIKLENVLIADDDSCKLGDFGLVVDVDKANRHETTEGDSRYIAPEIMQGKFSKASDVFSLGIAMLELSCLLDLPSNGTLWQQLRSGILPEDLPKCLSEELLTIIKQMMAPDPLTRPTVAQLLTHKKFVGILQRRQRWELFRKVKHIIRKSHRLAWSKLCNFNKVLLTLFAWLLILLKLLAAITAKLTQCNQEPLQHQYQQSAVANGSTHQNGNIKTPTVICTHIISSTPISADVYNTQADVDFIADNSYELSQHATPNNFSADHIVNSTPVNYNHHSFRSRKDLTKTSFNVVNDIEPKLHFSDGPNNNFLSLDEIEGNCNSFLRQFSDLSSIRRKMLFQKSDDSD